MHPIDRFTRDEASAKVWWPFALLLIVAVVLTFPGQDRAIADDRSEAAEQAATVSVSLAEAPAITEGIMASTPAVSAIRTWDADGSLLSSTGQADEIGSQAALNDRFLQAAVDDPGDPVVEESSATPTGAEAEPTMRVFTAVGDVIVEIEYLDETLLASTRDLWRSLQIALAVAVLLVLGLAIASMRTPVAPIGAGVRFYPESVPPGAVVLDADEATELRHAGAYARRRITEQKERVEELEHEKLRLEGELQRSLSARSLTQGSRTAIPRPAEVAADVAPPQPTGMPAPAVVPEVPVISIPDPEPVAVVEAPPARPEVEPVVVAEEPPLAPEPAPEPVAEVRPQPEPVPEAPAPRPARTRKAAAPAAASTPDDSLGFVLVPETEVVAPNAPATQRRKPAAKVVQIPEAQDEVDERHDAEVLDVLERLVEPVGSGSTADPGEMRARLARTAAAKKPGSRSDERFHEQG